MSHETQLARRVAAPIGRRLIVTSALLFANLLAGCSIVERLPGPSSKHMVGAEEPIDTRDPVAALIAYHGMLDQLATPELRAAQRALADPGEDPLAQTRSAILLGHPRAPSDSTRARNLLEAVNASDHAEAIKLQALVRLLLSELRARMQLTRDFERIDAQRRASETARRDLQQKLDALTEIERSLPARPTVDATPPEATEENDRP